MAYKVFSNGNALNASELNTYLMNQSVISFASTTARDAALTAPIEGQLVWLEDSNKYVYYNGSAWTDLVTPASSGNAIINGAFDIWQRGTTLTRSGAGNTADYLADRFRTDRETSGVVISQQAFTPGTAPVAGYESTYFLRNVVTSVAAAGNYVLVQQPVEDVRSFAGQTITVSFWAKADAVKSVAIEIAQNFGSGGSSQVTTAGGKIALTTSWARYSATVAVPSVSGKTIGTGSYLAFRIWLDAGSNFDARTGTLGQQSGTFDIWGVQLESGSSATAFKRNASNIQGELAACQRYYYRVSDSGSNAAVGPIGVQISGTQSDFVYIFPSMRTVSSIEVQNVGAFKTLNGVVYSGGTWIVASAKEGYTYIRYTHGSSVFTAGNPSTMLTSASNGYFALSSEL